MATAYTSLLGLALPVTGELSGTWGTTVNDAITSLLDSAVAGTTTISTDADITLSTTTGAANESREAILLWTAGGTVTRNITAPAQSKVYVVINKSSNTQSIVLRGVGPTTGVTIVLNEKAVCAWNGSDFVKVASTVITNSTGTLTVANGGTGAATLTANNVLLGNGTSALQAVAPSTSGNVLTSNGTTWTSAAPSGGSTGTAATVFTSGGTFTIPTGVTKIKMTIVGGGGNGSSASQPNGGTGGGGGGAAIKFLSGLTPGNTLTVTVGTAQNTSSVASGTQSITTVSATGGSAPTGGIGSSGDMNIKGQGGGWGTIGITGSGNTRGGAGGSSIFGGGAPGSTSGDNARSTAGGAYGGGGNGGNFDTACGGSGNQGGGAGASGVVLIEYVA